MLDFLRSQKKGGETLLLSSRINTVQKLRHLLLKADRLLERYEEEVRRRGNAVAPCQEMAGGVPAHSAPATPIACELRGQGQA